ncbi:hypothetical protein Dform_02081 [Dehalogenimonas formicexedens]|uniref:Adenosyl-chloride synthase n=1 Tax=Dehalogenimonas formicexedens TaxID=1839801 RepID=A0A1P8FAB5_9CHLR|nr:SAM-dependent chlorinase/fluorinase [Dehalogenimonas formicexedens]APV45390.1 hypothetical protein Dform_02081 [Dehalogenimonas formicexedens]
MSGIITLTTDFGDSGGYIAAMKGVILGIAPETQIVDISHRISPQNVFEAAFTLATVYRFFPENTVHLVVVDPGVGTGRKIITVKTPEGIFVGPDNGVFSYVLRDYATQIGPSEDGRHRAELAAAAQAVAVTNSRHFRQPVSNTFHGRDIMAPVAAMLSKGFELTAFGEPMDRLVMLDLPQATRQTDGSILGRIVIVDSFGNLITDVRADDLPLGNRLRVELGKYVISGLKKTYAEGTGLIALIGSSGYLEIAVPGGSAAASTGIQAGGKIRISSE